MQNITKVNAAEPQTNYNTMASWEKFMFAMIFFFAFLFCAIGCFYNSINRGRLLANPRHRQKLALYAAFSGAILSGLLLFYVVLAREEAPINLENKMFWVLAGFSASFSLGTSCLTYHCIYRLTNRERGLIDNQSRQRNYPPMSPSEWSRVLHEASNDEIEVVEINNNHDSDNDENEENSENRPRQQSIEIYHPTLSP